MVGTAVKRWSSFFARSLGTLTDDSSVDAAVADLMRTHAPEPEEEPRPSSSPGHSELRFLTPNETHQWDALLDASPHSSVFCKSWWLKAVGDDTRVLGYFESGRLVAGIPLHFERRMGLKLCTMPKLTQTWGVIMAPFPGKRAAVAARETRILEAFAKWLGQIPSFIQGFHPDCQNWLPFHWNGFTQTTHYTYILDDLRDLNRVWDGFEQNQRTRIRKAQRLGITVRTCSPEEVFEASTKSFDRQGKLHPFPLDYLRRLYNAARENHAGECFAAVDRAGRVHDAVFFVWDVNRGYYLAGGGDPELRNSGGGSLLVWHLVQFAASRTCVFDFEGSMIKPIESFFRSFGAKRVGYNRVIKLPRWFRACLCLAGKL